MKCPQCGYDFHVTRTPEHRKLLAQQAEERWIAIKSIYARAAQKHPQIDPLGDIGPRSDSRRLMRVLWEEWWRERGLRKPDVDFFHFDPWGEHTSSRGAFEHTFGVNVRARSHGYRLFGTDFGAEA